MNIIEFKECPAYCRNMLCVVHYERSISNNFMCSKCCWNDIS